MGRRVGAKVGARVGAGVGARVGGATHEDAPAADVHRASHDTHDDDEVAPVLVL